MSSWGCSAPRPSWAAAWAGSSPGVAGTTALAAFALVLGPGHNIPLLGGTPAVAKELVILAVVVGVASVVLVDAHAWLMRLPPTYRSGAQS